MPDPVGDLLRDVYLPSPGGKRSLVLAPLPREALAPIDVVLNWDAALRR